MAKPRKQKTEDHRPEQSGAVVCHQKLCISVDMSRRCIYGYTELKVVVPENGHVGLHADNMTIDHISVDGESADFEFFQHYQVAQDDRRWSSVSCSSSSADAACSTYVSFLDKEMAPNLFIYCHKSVKSGSDPQQQANGEDNSVYLSSGGSQDDACRNNGDMMHENMKMIRIDYWIDKPETGIHFGEKVLHTNNQIRRACCWFPCIDSSVQRCCYDLEFTVDSDLVAVSNGTLLYQVLSRDNPPRKTYIYRLNVPVTARWISLAVAPFEVLPDSQNSMLTHMCLPSSISKLRNTVGFFYNTFSHYEEYFSASFPFGSYTHVFITPEMAVTSMSLGASMCVFSSHVLFDEKIIDQTIDTRVKLAYALARQWFGVFITAEEPNDEWLLDGLAGFLTDSFIKRFLGNNEARYCRYKANCAVCKADVNGLTALSSSAASTDLYGTQCIGFYGKIRSWKSVAILQMLEKQMGPESFRKILQNIISRAKNTTRSLRTLSTKEFRRLANKVGNLERPFLKEFFPRWVGSCGCPVLRMGFQYNKRRNMIELAVLRGCTAPANSTILESKGNPDAVTREGDVGWPGMMSIRVHELDGMYDHPILPMAGETCQVLEIQCHSKLSAKRIQKSKKVSKPDGTDDNVDMAPALDVRSSAESPLLWVRVDPELEYLAEIQFHQPVQMWINQLEKDKDVVAQSQAITILESLPHHSFSAVNALNNFLTDSKAFWRVRIEAAFALAHTASEENDYAGLLHLIKFYKNRRFDSTIGLPRPNNFHDFSEYFVLKAIPQAIAMVRGPDENSPREAVEFIAELLKGMSLLIGGNGSSQSEMMKWIFMLNTQNSWVLKQQFKAYNDNNGNPYSDVYWLAAIVQSIGALEFGQQNLQLLSSILKRIDRLLQFDRLMPSYNGILTVSCLHTLTQIALKFSTSLIHDRVFDLIKPFCNFGMAIWQVRIEASRALLDLEFYCKGIDEALSLFLTFIEEEPSLRGQVELAAHTMHLCQMKNGSIPFDMVKSSTLVALLYQLESRRSFNNVFLRHYLFCVLQILSGRSPTLYGVPRVKVQPTVYLDQHPPVAVEEPTVNLEHSMVDAEHPTVDLERLANHTEHPTVDADAYSEPLESEARSAVLKLKVTKSQETATDTSQGILPDNLPVPEHPKDADTISNGTERKSSIVKIRVKPQGVASGRVDDVDAVGGGHNENEVAPTSSVSVDAPPRIKNKSVSPGRQNFEEANSHEYVSRMTASIGSAKFLNDDEASKELQCTADSRKSGPVSDLASPSFKPINAAEAEGQMHTPTESRDRASLDRENRKEKKDKKEKKKEKKRKREEKGREKDHHEDPEYLERKRWKKEKKKREKEKEKLKGETKTRTEDVHGSGNSESNMQATTSLGLGKFNNVIGTKAGKVIGTKARKSDEESGHEVPLVDPRKLYDMTRSKEDKSAEAEPATNKSSALKIRIKFKK